MNSSGRDRGRPPYFRSEARFACFVFLLFVGVPILLGGHPIS